MSEKRVNPGKDEPWDGGCEELEWQEISRPGCYLFVDTGDLVRVPTEGLNHGAMPVISIVSRARRRLARISNNPIESLPALRAIASENGYYVCF